MYKLTLAFLSLIFVFASPAAAAGSAGDNWVVTQLSGDARVVHRGAQPASLQLNAQLTPGDMLVTGASGRATLVHGGDYIIVAPRSELKLPSTPQPTGFTRVIQNLGTLLFKVQHTGIPHFAVDTPMLAAVVKGTTFTVVVDQQRSAVQVIQGVVQVSTLDGGMTKMVERGRTVFIEHATPKLLRDADKPLPATNSHSTTGVSVSAAGDAPLASIATLTGGLVRADLTAPMDATRASASPAALLVRSNPSTVQPGSTPATSAAGTAPATTNSPASPGTAIVASVPPAGAPPAAAPPSPPLIIATTVVGSTSVVTTPTVTTPAVTVPPTTPTVTIPTVTIASNSGPGSLNSGPGSVSSGSNGGGGGINSGPGSVSSGSNSGPGSLNSGHGSPGSGSGSGSGGGSVTVPTVTTPTLTVVSTTSPVMPVTTPTVTVPSVTTTPSGPSTAPLVAVSGTTTPIVPITTPTITVPNVTSPPTPTPSPTVTIPSITTPIVPITTPTVAVALPSLLKF